MGAFFDLQNLLSYQNVLVIVAAWTIITTLRKMAPSFFTAGIGQRLLPLLPLVVCQALVWATMVWQPTSTVGEKILLGFVLGALTSNAHSVLRRFGLHEVVPGLRRGDRGIV
jgi:hypothetical protein